MERFAVIVTGSREWADYGAVATLLWKLEYGTIVIHGAAKGADQCASTFCTSSGRLREIAMPAQWDRHGTRAGPIRNAEMLKVLLALRECGYCVRVEAFPLPGSVGTWDMVRRAEAAGVEVRLHKGEE